MKYFFSGIVSALLLFCMFVLATPVLADSYGLSATAGAAKLISSRTPPEIAGQVIGAALSLVGVMFFVLMIYSGITWMMARGNEEQTKQALRTIVAAIIGLIIVLASYAITTFVFESIYGGELAPGGSGGGSAQPAECATRFGDSGFSCKNITTCTTLGAANPDVSDVSALRGACDETTTSCALNMCPGGDDVVCCD